MNNIFFEIIHLTTFLFIASAKIHINLKKNDFATLFLVLFDQRRLFGSICRVKRKTTDGKGNKGMDKPKLKV